MSNALRILYLSPWCPFPADNGFKQRVFHLAKALSRAHEVTLVSFAFGTANPGVIDLGFGDSFGHYEVPMNPFERGRLLGALRFFSPTPIHELPVPEMEALVLRLRREQKYDLIISASTMMAPYALMFRDAGRYLEEHNFGTSWSWERYQRAPGSLSRARAWFSWLKQRRYDRRVFQRFDLLSMVSGVDRAAVCRQFPELGGRVEVVPNGVDCTENPFRTNDGAQDRLIFNGALTFSENFEAMRYFLAAVYPEIRRQQPGVRLTITGSTKGAHLGGLMLGDSVELTGYLEDVRPAVREATVSVAPIVGGGGTRLKILEAMALGTPVVASSKGAEGLEVTDGKHLLLADTAERFCEQVMRLLRSPELRNKIRSEARLLVESKYEWSAIGKAFVAICENVVESSRQSGPRLKARVVE